MRISSRVHRIVLLMALAACSHGEPFATPEHGTDAPLQGGSPVRLTYNPGTDQGATWLPDESGLLYSADRLDRDDHDRCLELLPPTGGRIVRTWCNTALAADDSLNTFDAAAVSPGGRVAFARTSRLPNQATFRFNELAVAGFDSIATAHTLWSLPFTLGTMLMTAVAQLRWADESTLVYRGGYAGFACIDFGAPCPRAYVESGFALVQQSADGGTPVMVSGTDYASSVAVMPGGDAILYTVMGDSRVYRRVLSTGATIVFYDFGASAGIVRGVQISGSRLVALVGGAVRVIDPAVSPGAPLLQYDLGGDIVVVDLVTGAGTVLNAAFTYYLNPALSPSGRRLVAERGGDLWLFDLP